MCGWIGQRINDLQLLDDRTRPAMCDQKRQGGFMLGATMNAVNVEPVNLGLEIGNGIQPRFNLPPVIWGAPMLQDLLDGLQGNALRKVGNSLLVRQARDGEALFEIG